MKKFNKSIIFALLGLITSNTMVIAMETDEKDRDEKIIELEKQFIELELSDSSSKIYTEVPERSLSAPLESQKEVVELKPKSQSEEETKKEKVKVLPKQRRSLRKDLLCFNQAVVLLLDGIKNNDIDKMRGAIQLCPKCMKKRLLSEVLPGEKNLNLNALSLLIGLHGKNLQTCVPMLNLLIENGACELHNCTLLHTAAFFNCPKLIRLLLENKFVGLLKLGGESEKLSPLHVALKYKCFAAARTLIMFYNNKKGEKILAMMINQQDSSLLTPLHYLLDTEFDGYIPAELEYQDDKLVYVHYEYPSSVLQVDMVDMVKLLCELGADINACDNNARKPRHLASEQGRKGNFIEVIDFYVEKLEKQKKKKK
jgi:hypothetical protein